MGQKRKATSASATEQPPAKKPTGSVVKVKHLAGPDVAKPVVALSPGVALPSNLAFKAYCKQDTTGHTDLLLQSQDHPTIDYLATESYVSDVAEKHLRHYIAVFDPATNKLQVTEAKRMTVRSTVRQLDQRAESDDEETQPAVSNYTSRAALTAAFGTKKSKKAVQSIAENRLLARGGDDGDANDNPLSSAILSSVKDEDTDPVPSSPSDSVSTKPLPKPNLTATEIRDFYPLTSLIQPGPFRTTLSQMPTAEWLAQAESAKGITTRSRFVSNRVGYLTRALAASPTDRFLLTSVQSLSYLALLLEVHKWISRLPTRRQIPHPDNWPATTLSETYASLSTAFASKLVTSFFPARQPSTFHLTRLRTTILALTLLVPPPTLLPSPELLATDMTDISLDLALPQPEVQKLYRELGCRIETLNEKERVRLGWDRIERQRALLGGDEGGDGKAGAGAKVKFAKLRFPVEFPKLSTGRPTGRR